LNHSPAFVADDIAPATIFIKVRESPVHIQSQQAVWRCLPSSSSPSILLCFFLVKQLWRSAIKKTILICFYMKCYESVYAALECPNTWYFLLHCLLPPPDALPPPSAHRLDTTW
jgi:hypothetical protein